MVCSWRAVNRRCAEATAARLRGERLDAAGLESLPPAVDRRPVDNDDLADFRERVILLAQANRHASLFCLGRGGQAACISTPASGRVVYQQRQRVSTSDQPSANTMCLGSEALRRACDR